MGPTTRFSISSGMAPGISTMMSIMGTMICGSSSLGVRSTAKTPRKMARLMISGTSLESTKLAVIRVSVSWSWCWDMV